MRQIMDRGGAGAVRLQNASQKRLLSRGSTYGRMAAGHILDKT